MYSAVGLTALNSTSAVVLAFWWRSLPQFSTVIADVFSHHSTENAARFGYGFQITATGLFRSVYRSASSSVTADITAPTSAQRLRSGRWTHVAVAFSPLVTSLFMDGFLLGQNVINRPMVMTPDCTTSLIYTGNTNLRGELFDVQVAPDLTPSLSDVRQMMQPRDLHPSVRARWLGVQPRRIGALGTLWDESGNGHHLIAQNTASPSAFTQGGEPVLRPSLL